MRVQRIAGIAHAGAGTCRSLWRVDIGAARVSGHRFDTCAWAGSGTRIAGNQMYMLGYIRLAGSRKPCQGPASTIET